MSSISGRGVGAAAAVAPSSSSFAAGQGPAEVEVVDTTPPTNNELLYHQTLISTQSVSHAVEGSFTLPDANDVVIIHHDTLELWRLYTEDGSSAAGGMECISRTSLGASVYAAVAVPTQGGMSMSRTTKHASAMGGGGILDDGDGGSGPTAYRSGLDYLAVTSDTGFVTLLRYELEEPPVPTRVTYDTPVNAVEDPNHHQAMGPTSATVLITTSLRGRFVKVGEICLGRSGARLTVPGMRMAVDPGGRALFITALMRAKVLVPLLKNTEWDPTKQTSGDTASEEDEEDDIDDDGGGADVDDNGEMRGPMSGVQRRAARRRRAAAARHANGAISLGNPIEVLRQTVLYSVCALDGFIDNVVFLVLEEEVVEAGSDVDVVSPDHNNNNSAVASGRTFLKKVAQRHKHFVRYDYVPSLQQVQRTQLVHVPATAHRLIPVPAAPYGPGGVLVCTDTELIWYDISPVQHAAASPSAPGGSRAGIFKCSCALPRRLDYTDLGYDPSIIHYAITCFGTRFFLVIQDEQGDVFRVFLNTSDVQSAYEALQTQQQLMAQGGGGAKPPTVPNPLAVHYFDTLPPASAIALFRRGYLFLGSEAGPSHGLYKVRSNGYTNDKEYILRRVRREKTLPVAPDASSSSLTVKEEGGTAEADVTDEKSGTLGEKRTRSDGPMAMPAPMRAPSGTAGTAKTVAGEVRIIKEYQPHRRPQHVVQLQRYPNTPAIASFTTHLSGATAPTTEEEEAAAQRNGSHEKEQQQQQQPQLYFNYVGGRGSESSLVQARFGYAAKLEGRHVLPTFFNTIIVLPSAAAMQNLVRQQQAAISAAATGADGVGMHRVPGRTRQHAQRLRALRQLAATVSNARDQVWTDRVLLCTRQGTTVYRISASVEPDTMSGFITAERTLAATTLKYGSGYVQVTPRGLQVLSSSSLSSAAMLPVNSKANNSGAGAEGDAALSMVVPSSWTHPHGNTVLAAAVSPTTVILSFHQHGGIASFDFGLAGMELQQRDVLPTFPTAPVVALLQPPVSAVSVALQSELQTLLLGSSSSKTTAAAAAAAATQAAQTMQLAAIATVAQEVYLVHPQRLREPLEKLVCRRRSSSGGGHGDEGEASITSLLLTYLGGSGTTVAAAQTGATAGAAQQRRKLFLFVGHSDGVVQRFELNPVSAKVTDSAELWCGKQPCQLIAGDGESICYVVSGDRAWRCEVQNGVAAMAPFNFPSRPTSFARFVLPTRLASSSAAPQSNDITAVKMEDKEEEEEEGDEAEQQTISLTSREQREEVIIAVSERHLDLYVATGGAGSGGGGGGSGGVEYSFRHTPLPLAGRRLLQHPTRPSYLILCGVEHRSHSRAAIERHLQEDKTVLASRIATSSSPAVAAMLYGGIPYTAPQHSLGVPNVYHSTLQLYNEATQRLLPPVYLEDGESITAVVVGSFVREFGQEPVVVVATASSFSHGAGCGAAASWRQGFLRAFRCVSAATASASGGGGTVLRLEQVHSTYLRPDADPSCRGGASKMLSPDYASALCLCPEVGLLFVGMGSAHGLRVYSWGKEHLLRRRHLANTPGRRIIAIDYVFTRPPGSDRVNRTAFSFYAADLYQTPYGDAEAMRQSCEGQLLIVCGTSDASVFVAAMQPSGSGVPSYLLQILVDRVPRHLTSIAVVDERTIAVADRFGTITFLRIPESTRFSFAEPIAQMQDAELNTAEAYLRDAQFLEDVAHYSTGQVVTALRVQPYDPSNGADASLAIKIVYYTTSLGAVGAFVPFVSEEDGALAAYLQPLLVANQRPLLGPTAAVRPAVVKSKRVIDGDAAQLLRSSARDSMFSASAKQTIDEALQRSGKMETAQRAALGLPARQLPTLTELLAKQRALLTLPL